MVLVICEYFNHLCPDIPLTSVSIVGCNINIIIALYDLDLYKTAYHVAETASNLTFITNRERAKILFCKCPISICLRLSN